MKNLPENISPEEIEQCEKILDPIDSQPSRPGFWSRNGILIGALLLSVICVCVAAYMLIDTLTVGARAAEDAYANEKSEAETEIYNDFYQRSYDISEQQHHVSNKISITIGSLKEQDKLEVLKVSEVEYVTPTEDEGNWIDNVKCALSDLFLGDVVSWLEVPGYGVFTVDLQSSEFIIDDDRQYVLVRVPEPKLSEFTLDYENVELLNFDEMGIFKDSAKVGEDIAREQLQSAELTMLQDASANQEFYQSARDSTETMLVTLIKELNPSLEDLTVEVEFID